MNITDHISKCLKTMVWVKKYFNSLKRMRIRDPESLKAWIRDEKLRIRNKYPGSTALLSDMKIPNYGHTKKEPS
jgi:hypothetical protein